MAEHFKVVFEGQLRTGVELETARLNLAQLFKSETSAIDRLFSGKPVTVKRELTYDDAQRYVQALNEAGVEARIELEQPLTLNLAHIDEPVPPHQAVENHGAESPYAPPRAPVADTRPAAAELKVFSIQGRIGRLRYLAWTMVLALVSTVIAALCAGIMNTSLILGGLLAAIALTACAVVGIQISAQRLHDAGWSAWLLLVNLVPAIGTIFPILLIVVPGNAGPNQYGPPPPSNGKGVKALAALWVVVLALVAASVLMGGLEAFKGEVDTTTSEYEQALPYDDDNDNAAQPADPSDSSDSDEDQ